MLEAETGTPVVSETNYLEKPQAEQAFYGPQARMEDDRQYTQFNFEPQLPQTAVICCCLASVAIVGFVCPLVARRQPYCHHY